jgi:hypothetical protein
MNKVIELQYSDDKKSSDKSISSWCSGGATYSFIDKNGNIINPTNSPMLLTKKEINQYIERIVR